jgi:hypothetical protein
MDWDHAVVNWRRVNPDGTYNVSAEYDPTRIYETTRISDDDIPIEVASCPTGENVCTSVSFKVTFSKKVLSHVGQTFEADKDEWGYEEFTEVTEGGCVPLLVMDNGGRRSMVASSVCEYTRNHAAVAMEEQRLAGEYDLATIDNFVCMTCDTDGCNPTLASNISAACRSMASMCAMVMAVMASVLLAYV